MRNYNIFVYLGLVNVFVVSGMDIFDNSLQETKQKFIYFTHDFCPRENVDVRPKYITNDLPLSNRNTEVYGSSVVMWIKKMTLRS